MKRLVKEHDTLEINIEVIFTDGDLNLVATTIHQITDSRGNIISGQAYADYMAFVEMLLEILDIYEFEIIDEKEVNSKTSYYMWIARRGEVEANDVPKLIKLRVSDHKQNYPKDRERQIRQQNKSEAQKLKQPKTKQTQRYTVQEIIADGQHFKTYEEVLNDTELKIRNWLESKDVDISDIEYVPW